MSVVQRFVEEYVGGFGTAATTIAFDAFRSFVEAATDTLDEDVRFTPPYTLMIICPDCGKHAAYRGTCPKCGGKSWVPAGTAKGYEYQPYADEDEEQERELVLTS